MSSFRDWWVTRALELEQNIPLSRADAPLAIQFFCSGTDNMSRDFGGRHCSNLENSKRTISNAPEDTTNHINQQNRVTPKHKYFHLRFLTWVAYSRKYAPNMDDTQRRTCPLIGCQQAFFNQETMLDHVYTCPYLWKGVYWCSACGKKEPISKYYTNGDCRSPHFGMNKLFTVANSFRLAKQFFSHTSKGRQATQLLSSKRQSLPMEYVELSGDQAGLEMGVAELGVDADTPLNELDTGCNLRKNLHGSVRELQGSVIPVELRGDDEYIRRGYCHLQTEPLELDTSYNSMDFPDGHEGSGSVPAGSYIPYPIQPTQHTSHHHQRFHSWLPPMANGQGTPRGLRVQIPDVEHSSVSRCAGDFSRLYDHAPAAPGSARNYEHINFSDTLTRMNVPDDERISPAISPVSPVESSTSSGNSTGFSSDSIESILSPLTPSTPISQQNTQAKSHYQHSYGFPRYGKPEFEILEPLPEAGTSTCATFGLDDYSFGSGVFSTENTPANIMQNPTQNNSRRSEVPVSPAFPSLESSPEALIAKSTPPEIPHYCESDYRCSDCGFQPGGKEVNKKSNLKRHRLKSCKRYSPYSGSKKTHKCTYRDCGRRFTRSDNLLVHRRNKGHFEVFELGADMPPPKLDLRTMSERYGEGHSVVGWGSLNVNEWSEITSRDY